MERSESLTNKSLPYRPIQKLPKNFFEKMLELELKIKREFMIDRLQELIQLYSIAVEYYESIEDDRYKDYQNRLNLLLSQPEILKKMNELITKRNSKSVDTPKGENDDVSQARKIHSEMRKKQIKQKINYYINQINVNNQNCQVNKILEEINKETKTETVGVNDIVNEEMNKQGDNFQSKLAQKRRNTVKRKYSKLLSQKLPNEVNLVEFRMKKCVTVHNRNLGSNESKFRANETSDVNDNQTPIDKDNKSDISEKKSLNDANDQENYSCSGYSDKEENHQNNIIVIENSFDRYEDKKISELDEIFRKIEIQEKNLNETLNENLQENRLDDENDEDDEKRYSSQRNLRHLTLKDLNASIYKIDESIFESKHIGPKHRQIFLEIKDALEQFVDEFNFYFYEYVFQRFAEQIQKLMDEKYEKYVEVARNYQSQIKEMEFIINGADSDDQHTKGIISIVESLKEEQENELDRIEDHYSKLVTDAQNNFKNISFKNNPGVQLIEEKFKLDLYNLINLIISPYKNIHKVQV